MLNYFRIGFWMLDTAEPTVNLMAANCQGGQRLVPMHLKGDNKAGKNVCG
jgi:hypothetical protein